MSINLQNNIDPNSVLDAKKDKIYYYPLNSLKPNPLNYIYEQEDSLEEMEELKESIIKNGLQQPITVTRSGDSLIVMSGHRRCKALNKIFKEQDTVKFNGKDINVDTVPLIIQAEYKTEEEQFNCLVASNKYRTIKPATTAKIIEKAKSYYETQVSEGIKEKGRTRDKIAKIAGVSGRTVERYLKQPKDEQAAKCLKKVNSITRYLKTFNIYDFSNTDRMNIRDALDKLSDAINIATSK